MKPPKILSLFLIFICSHLYCQKDYFGYDQIKINASQPIEKKFNSVAFLPKFETYYNNSDDLAQPKSFRRPKTDEFLPATVYYYYTKKDSIVKRITYNWNLNIRNDVAQSKKMEQYNAEYDRLVKVISNYIGAPKPNQGQIIKGKESLIGDGQTEKYERRVAWDYKNCKISIILVWAEKHGQSLVMNVSWNN